MRTPLFLSFPGDALAVPAPSGLAARVAGMLQALRRWQAERRTVAELGQLDEATLRDIGVTRADLRAGLVREQMLRRDAMARM
jgi:uncharacterized protein YjiS (DUF1127 family)